METKQFWFLSHLEYTLFTLASKSLFLSNTPIEKYSSRWKTQKVLKEASKWELFIYSMPQIMTFLVSLAQELAQMYPETKENTWQQPYSSVRLDVFQVLLTNSNVKVGILCVLESSCNIKL